MPQFHSRFTLPFGYAQATNIVFHNGEVVGRSYSKGTLDETQRNSAIKGSREEDGSPSSAGPSCFQSNSTRKDRVETVCSIPTVGAPCDCCWCTSSRRTLHDKGQGAWRCEVDGAQSPRRPGLHGYLWHFLYRPG